jgi:hypothetical protein
VTPIVIMVVCGRFNEIDKSAVTVVRSFLRLPLPKEKDHHDRRENWGVTLAEIKRLLSTGKNVRRSCGRSYRRCLKPR